MSENKLFGRKWRILVLKADGNTAWEITNSDVEEKGGTPLRCTFTVEKVGYQTPWYADLAIWNLAGDTTQDIITECQKEGSRVIIEAGYKDGAYGKICDMPIFQPLFTRENVTDHILTLHCIDGLGVMTGNFASLTLNSGVKYGDIIKKMAATAKTPIPVDKISSSLSEKKSDRGVVIFGDPKEYLRDICRDEVAQWWTDAGKLNINKLDDNYTGEALVISPSTGLIGTPEQVTNGVSFRTLLNPNLKLSNPMMVVKIDQAVIRQMKLQYGSLPPSPLDQDGQYKIIKVVYSGDTRGDEWYSSCVGINLVGNVSALLGMVQQ